MKILVLNGPNLNMLGIREPGLYGEKSYKGLVSLCKKTAKEQGVKVKVMQTNCEGKLVTLIQKAYKKYDGIVINAGAYTHTSIAILDALKAVDIPTVEVHISDISSREDFRRVSYIRSSCLMSIVGHGTKGYLEAIDALCAFIRGKEL